ENFRSFSRLRLAVPGIAWQKSVVTVSGKPKAFRTAMRLSRKLTSSAVSLPSFTVFYGTIRMTALDIPRLLQGASHGIIAAPHAASLRKNPLDRAFDRSRNF